MKEVLNPRGRLRGRQFGIVELDILFKRDFPFEAFQTKAFVVIHQPPHRCFEISFRRLMPEPVFGGVPLQANLLRRDQLRIIKFGVLIPLKENLFDMLDIRPIRGPIERPHKGKNHSLRVGSGEFLKNDIAQAADGRSLKKAGKTLFRFPGTGQCPSDG